MDEGYEDINIETRSWSKNVLLELAMNNYWMTEHRDTWFYTGDRLEGMDQSQDLHRVTMTIEVIDGQKVWVVDIYRKKPFSEHSLFT